MDIFGFISMPLTNNMLEKFSLTLVGSLRDNPDVYNCRESICYQLTYENNKTLVSCKPKNDEIIL